MRKVFLSGGDAYVISRDVISVRCRSPHPPSHFPPQPGAIFKELLLLLLLPTTSCIFAFPIARVHPSSQALQSRRSSSATFACGCRASSRRMRATSSPRQKRSQSASGPSSKTSQTHTSARTSPRQAPSLAGDGTTHLGVCALHSCGGARMICGRENAVSPAQVVWLKSCLIHLQGHSRQDPDCHAEVGANVHEGSVQQDERQPAPPEARRKDAVWPLPKGHRGHAGGLDCLVARVDDEGPLKGEGAKLLKGVWMSRLFGGAR